MPSLRHRPFAVIAAIVTATALLPLAIATSPAVAEPDSTPGFAQVPVGIPSAEQALTHAKAVVAGRAARPDLTLALRDLAARLPEYSGADRALAEQLLARPNGGNTGVENQIGATWPGYEAGQSPACSATIPLCVHWTDTSIHQPPAADSDADGVPNQVEDTLGVMTNVWQTETGTFGYREPLTDERASKDGDGVDFDVYLSDIGGGGYYGYCAIDDSRTFRNYNFYDRSGYCVLDDDFSPSQFPTNTPLENLQVTAAHEFFHAVQFGYDAFEDPWLMEGTAAWIEDEVYDGVDDNRQYLQRSQLVNPDKPLDTSKGITVYGSWGFFRNLSERFGRDVVRQAWDRADGSKTGPDDYSLRGVTKAIEAQGFGLGGVFADYARANLAPAEYYQEGASYPTPSTNARRLGGSAQTTAWLRERIDHLSIAYKAAQPNGSAGLNARLQVRVDAPARSTGSQARVLVKYSDGSYGVEKVALDGAGDGAVVVDFGRNAVQRVSVALVNASDQFDKCFRYNTQYSCGGGTPVDDNRSYAVKFTLT